MTPKELSELTEALRVFEFCKTGFVTLDAPMNYEQACKIILDTCKSVLDGKLCEAATEEEIAGIIHQVIFSKPMSEDNPVKNLEIYGVAKSLVGKVGKPEMSRDALIKIIDTALEAPLPDGDKTTAEEIADALLALPAGEK
jgi:hypothetical protein